jgi:alpha-N-acetylglucosamine transferase
MRAIMLGQRPPRNTFAIFIGIMVFAFLLCNGLPGRSVDWSQFAYVHYVTNEHYLCNSLMLLESLQRLGSKADRVTLYPREWSSLPSTDRTRQLLNQAQKEYGTRLVPVGVVSRLKEGGESTWAESYTKLLAFRQTQYKRVIVLGSDAVLRNVSMCPQSMSDVLLISSISTSTNSSSCLRHQ